MNNYGLIISCNDIEESKNFYLKFLQLDNPIIDCNDWVEFAFPNGTILSLSKFNQIKSSGIFIFYTKKYDELADRLTIENYKLSNFTNLPIKEDHSFFNDKENNVFVLVNQN